MALRHKGRGRAAHTGTAGAGKAGEEGGGVLFKARLGRRSARGRGRKRTA
jgi:hypothetical protein